MTSRLAVLATLTAPFAFCATDPSALVFNREVLKIPPLTLSDLLAQPAPSLSFASPSLPIAPTATPPRPAPRVPKSARLPLVEPDSSVDYKMVVVPPNPDIDFKVAIKVPATPEREESK